MLARVSHQTEGTSQLDANLAKQFAWLLREDLRNTFKTVDNPAFGDWWLIKGRQEYPAWAHAMPAQQLNRLFESAGKATIAGVSVIVPQVVQLLARFRVDAVREYTSNNKLDNEKFFAWAMVVGLTEHHLAEYAPRHILAMLDQTVPTHQAVPDSDVSVNTIPTAPEPTLLMYLLWRLMDEPTQKARNIFTLEGRLAYFAWFFSVLGQLNLVPLVAGRWKSWVKSQPSYKGPQLAWASAVSVISLPSTLPNIADKPFGVNLYGFAYGELGIGEDLRMAVACCEAANIPYHVVNVDAGNIRQADQLLKGRTHDLHSKESPPYRNNIFCLPAFDAASRIFMQKGAGVFEGYHNIGWWPWEVSVFPKAWLPHAFKLIDEVWASSIFLEDMYKRSTFKPVHLVPLAVSVERVKKRPRKFYGLPEKIFLFLYVFDFNSSVARKNPLATINAFKNGFSILDKSVGLVMKVMNASENSTVWQDILRHCKEDSRIYLLTETFDREDVLGLINCCDAYLSLHRSEGFGRTIAEAMLLGKKVIATNYSGNVDFLKNTDHELVEYKLIPIPLNEYHWIDRDDKANWADPHLQSAIKLMKKVRYEKNEARKMDLSKMSPNYIGSLLKNLLMSKV
jgi:glycosyltransferase involved in cell wall biosynthesis